MSLVRICDYCGTLITEGRTYAIKVSQKRTVREWDVRSEELCTWDCVVMYAMRMEDRISMERADLYDAAADYIEVHGWIVAGWRTPRGRCTSPVPSVPSSTPP